VRWTFFHTCVKKIYSSLQRCKNRSRIFKVMLTKVMPPLCMVHGVYDWLSQWLRLGRGIVWLVVTIRSGYTSSCSARIGVELSNVMLQTGPFSWMGNASAYSLVFIRSLWRHHLSTASRLTHISRPNKKQTGRLHYITRLGKVVDITTARYHHSAASASYNETELLPIAPRPQRI